jgi:antirestriction protein
MADINNMDDVIDSRDVIEKIEEIREEIEEMIENENDDFDDIDAVKKLVDETDNESEKYQNLIRTVESHGNTITELGDLFNDLGPLERLAEEASNYAPDWDHGETLIRETYFETYAQELAEDCGMVNSDATWPNNHIDWEAAARDLKQDYTEIDFDGVSYFIR